MILNAAFKNKKVPDYFDTESLYLTLDKLSGEAGLINDIETENLEGWESSILRRVADKLRSMNLTLEKAFKNNLGFIKIVDFKQLLFSLDINLSQKDVDLLISRLATASILMLSHLKSSSSDSGLASSKVKLSQTSSTLTTDQDKLLQCCSAELSSNSNFHCPMHGISWTERRTDML